MMGHSGYFDSAVCQAACRKGEGETADGPWRVLMLVDPSAFVFQARWCATTSPANGVCEEGRGEGG